MDRQSFTFNAPIRTRISYRALRICARMYNTRRKCTVAVGRFTRVKNPNEDQIRIRSTVIVMKENTVKKKKRTRHTGYLPRKKIWYPWWYTKIKYDIRLHVACGVCTCVYVWCVCVCVKNDKSIETTWIDVALESDSRSTASQRYVRRQTRHSDGDGAFARTRRVTYWIASCVVSRARAGQTGSWNVQCVWQVSAHSRILSPSLFSVAHQSPYMHLEVQSGRVGVIDWMIHSHQRRVCILFIFRHRLLTDSRSCSRCLLSRSMVSHAILCRFQTAFQI